MKEITAKQWQQYRNVQRSGLYGMSSPEAVRQSGLDIDIYKIIQRNYNKLFDKFVKGITDVKE